jgi:16S rRNA (cytosine1402-N4)-methyltransferase
MNQQADLSAFKVVNEYDESALTAILKNYGELTNARLIAREIILKRSEKLIETTGELMSIISRFAPKFKDHKFFAQVFQAIRIEVNQELEVLKNLLIQSSELLAENGRLVVISYHSLEDRLVKNFMKRGSFDGEVKKDFFGNILKPLTEVVRHPIVPSDEEINRNTRARSAKLRIAVKNVG